MITLSTMVARRSPVRRPTHPGALLREEIVPATGMTITELARRLTISRQQLYDILNERKPVSPTVAVKFGRLFGNGTGFWTRMQATYDTWEADSTVDVSGIRPLDIS